MISGWDMESKKHKVDVGALWISHENLRCLLFRTVKIYLYTRFEWLFCETVKMDVLVISGCLDIRHVSFPSKLKSRFGKFDVDVYVSYQISKNVFQIFGRLVKRTF